MPVTVRDNVTIQLLRPQSINLADDPTAGGEISTSGTSSTVAGGVQLSSTDTTASRLVYTRDADPVVGVQALLDVTSNTEVSGASIKVGVRAQSDDDHSMYTELTYNGTTWDLRNVRKVGGTAQPQTASAWSNGFATDLLFSLSFNMRLTTPDLAGQLAQSGAPATAGKPAVITGDTDIINYASAPNPLEFFVEVIGGTGGDIDVVVKEFKVNEGFGL